MPRTWHDRHAANKIETESVRDFYRSIVADKKPYFMRYIYPTLMKQYNTYIKNTDRNALREFQMTVSEMKKLPYQDLSERQKEFLRYFDHKMPVGTGDCVMNKICKRFESEFDGYIRKHNSSVKFDYTIMKGSSSYTTQQFNSIRKLYDDFNKRLRSYAVFADYERIDECDSYAEMSIMNDEFRRECNALCQNEDSLCNIILDLCYTRSSTKKFAWSMCGHDIIHNLLKKNKYTISFPTIDNNGDIKYNGDIFSISTKKFEVVE